MLYVLIAIVIIAVVLVGGTASLFVGRREAPSTGRGSTDSSRRGVPAGHGASSDDESRRRDRPEVMPEVLPDAFPDAGGTGGRPG